MQRLIPILVCLLALPLFADAPLTNDDVITMVHAGISTDVIIEKIKTSPTAFTTTTQALVHLGEAKVPEAIIKLMIGTTPAATTPPPTTTTTANTTATAARTIVEGIFFAVNYHWYWGDLVVDQRGVTFCCGRDSAIHNQYIRCTTSFQVPLATITTVHVMSDPDKLPGIHVIDAANQGYYFYVPTPTRLESLSGDGLSDRDQARLKVAFPKGIEALFALSPSIKREDHSWRDQKTVLRSYSPAAVTDGNVCVSPDYDIKPWGRQ